MDLSSPSGLNLIRAARRLAPLLLPDVPPRVVIQADRPPVPEHPCAVGLCWEQGRDCRVWISPELVEPEEILAVLLHEMAHAVVGPELMHAPKFVALARRVGFVAPFTAATVGPVLAAALASIATELMSQ